MSNQTTCITPNCTSKPILNGLCEQHYLQGMQHKFERELTIEAVHTGLIDGKIPEKAALQAELQQVKTWWVQAYDALSQGKADSTFREETGQVPEWCLTIAKGIIDEEKAHRENRQQDSFLNFEKRHTLTFFNNMSAGLQSNGEQHPEVQQEN